MLPDDTAQLQEICERVTYRDRVLNEWGFGASCPTAWGSTRSSPAPPGPGKTMAAEVIADELRLDLYRIDLVAGGQQVHRRDGEEPATRIFDAAETRNAILFFDEADALFGKRSEVHDAHDRYANIEVATCCRRWSSTRASRSWPPTCATTSTTPSCAGWRSASTSRSPTKRRAGGCGCGMAASGTGSDPWIDTPRPGSQVDRRQHQEHRPV